jgi:hypothetical protein
MSHKFLIIVLLAMALYASRARAGDPDTPMFLFSGFGTIGVIHSTENKADFTSSGFKPDGAGYSHAWSADVDSLLAAQITANFTPQLSAVLQTISEQNYDNTYRPHLERALVKYQVTPDFSVRIGRTLLPVFLTTDSRKIGYSNPWLRPPVEVYKLVPVTSIDGADASYRMPFGEATNTILLTAGVSDSRFHSSGVTSSAEARKVVAVADIFEHGFATVRLSYGRGRLTIPLYNQLFDAFRQFGPDGAAIAAKYDVNDSLITFAGFSASYDTGKWFATAEWGSVDTRSVLGKSTGWYASGGYRFGDFTPYVTYAAMSADNQRSDPGLTVSSLPAYLAGTATTLNDALNATLASKSEQNTISVGGRWDFAKNTALKVQVSHIRLGAGSPGTLSNIQPGFQPGGSLNLFAAALDFVF